MNKRPSYQQQDLSEREAQLSSRNNVIGKSSITEMWAAVIRRAIEDIALYRVMRAKGKKLREEDINDEISAVLFLFSDSYRIYIDDFSVTYTCPNCNFILIDYTSNLIGKRLLCPKCFHKTNKKHIDLYVVKKQIIRDMSLAELLGVWGMHDIEGFRSQAKREIEEITKNKLALYNKRK